jgi:glycine cleavage system H lipoate-binding protein
LATGLLLGKVYSDSSNNVRSKKRNHIGGGIMTVILVLCTFVTFLVIDHFYSKRKGVQPVLATAAAREMESTMPPARLQPSLVAGFKVPDNVRYHPGHTWALGESPNLVRVGLDDFAGKLAGKIDSITLPQRGQWIRQGQKIWSVIRDGQKVDMVSPIEGSVADINEAIVKNPDLARKDPYGDGWMVTVQAPDAKTNFRNLLGGALAKGWMEEAALRLQRRMPAMAGALMQDGGEAVNDLTTHIPDAEWAEITKEFFLS